MKSLRPMTRTQALFFIAIFWAAIYLPGLGSTEIKGEEGRRIMPAVAMIETGDWLVPHFNGKPYLRKPPLVNWMIAGCLELTGAKNEWVARMPSVLAVLALGLTIAGVGGGWLGVETAFVAAVLALTNIGMIEKGRLAELEAVYISLFGIAITCWLSWWATKKTRWLLWIVPSVFLGLGLLAKAPLHLLFFYAVVIPVLIRERKMRELLRAPHLLGVAMMVAIFVAWWIPYHASPGSRGASAVMIEQMRERLGGGDFSFKGYLANFPRGLGNYLPWLFFVPVLWSRDALSKLEERDAEIVRATRWPVTLGFFGLVLLNSQILPRYSLPMLVPMSLLLALVLRAKFGERPVRWAVWVGVVAGIAMILFAVFIVPRMNASEGTRVFAAQLDAAVPPGETLYIFNPGIQPAVFYIRSHLAYAYSPRELSENPECVLASGKDKKVLEKKWRETVVRAVLTDKNKNEFFLLQGRGKL